MKIGVSTNLMIEYTSLTDSSQACSIADGSLGVDNIELRCRPDRSQAFTVLRNSINLFSAGQPVGIAPHPSEPVRSVQFLKEPTDGNSQKFQRLSL